MYDLYRGTTDRTLRLATMPGAGLPADLKTQRLGSAPGWEIPLHWDTARDVGVRDYCFFQGIKGK
jgi:hypothetical protein